MTDPRSRDPGTRQLLELARTDRRAAAAAVAELSLDAQVAAVCDAPLAARARLLELSPAPEQLIPLLPEAELCFTVNALGLDDASWILEHASRDQIVACVDLDAWKALAPDVAALDRWFAVVAEAGDEALVRSAQSLDAELLVLHLRERVTVHLDAKDEGWQPPPGAQTLDGVFYLVANKDADDLAPVLKMLGALFRSDYWLYFRLLQGAVWELPGDLEEWALRWRSGRLEDLGFPSWDEAMRIYGYLRPERRAELPAEPSALEVGEWRLPVWLPELPVAAKAGHAVFRAASELSDEERHSFFYAFVGIANKVAVADHMALGDAETLPRAIEKAASVVSSGLLHIAEERGIALPEVLRRASLERLFRVGASLDPSVLER